MKKILGLYLILPLIATAETPQPSCEKLFEPIMQILKDNDADGLSGWFADVVELNVYGETKVYNKVQAKQVTRDFYKYMVAKQTVLKHCGGKAYLKYAVVEITDMDDLQYRAIMFMRIKDDGSAVIQEIQMEREENRHGTLH
jgi:hypothetical protein